MSDLDSATLCGVLLATLVAAVMRRPREPMKLGMSDQEKRAYLKRNTMLGRMVTWVEALLRKER